MRFCTRTECQIVGRPEDVHPEERVPARFPSQFSVGVVGSPDHFGGGNKTRGGRPGCALGATA